MSNLTIGKIANNSMTLVLASNILQSPPEVNQAILHTIPDPNTLAPVPFHSKFTIHIPNSLGFTHQTMCLCHVESVTGVVECENANEMVSALGVRISGMGPQRVFRNGTDTQDVGMVYLTDNQYAEQTFTRSTVVSAPFSIAQNPGPERFVKTQPIGSNKQGILISIGDVINNGVLCSTPFGKHLQVELYEYVTRRPLCPPGAQFLPHGAGGTHQQTPLAANAVNIKLRLLFLDENDLKDY